MLEFAIAIVAGLIVWGISRFALDKVRHSGLELGKPLVENPYGRDNDRNMPKVVRYLRLPVTAKYGRLNAVSASMKICRVSDGMSYDCPGELHWQRQPISGISHPLELHKRLATVADVCRHMYDFHFAHNEPVHISRGSTDKIDLLMKIEDMDDAITTVSRENHIPPGEYILEVVVSPQNISRSCRVSIKVWVGAEVTDLRVISD